MASSASILKNSFCILKKKEKFLSEYISQKIDKYEIKRVVWSDRFLILSAIFDVLAFFCPVTAIICVYEDYNLISTFFGMYYESP